MSENKYPDGFWIGLIGVTGLLQQKANSCSKGMSQQLQILSLALGFASLGVGLVGVREALELCLVQLLHQSDLHGGELDRLFSDRCVEVTHVHRVFLWQGD